jgi:hypothetical protein
VVICGSVAVIKKEGIAPGSVGFSDWLGLWRGIVNKCPSELLAKILEARLADPMIIVLGGIALV